MEIINYTKKHQQVVLQLIKQTIQIVNQADYSLEQVTTWSAIDEERWEQDMHQKMGKLAILNQQIVGFSDITTDGYIDYFFVHHAFQRQGIAKELLRQLELMHKGEKLTVAASITARPFFESQGYQVVQQNEVQVRGVSFINFLMEKQR
ncbi:GNAT family N-acetyltransferase [Enterococcus alcedinis]|uniref:Acetyltransferase n=1 Tax=Enterococcus alcedinis TaxID=1274384 RepID=A0A917JG46_9ENTE|nr:GNAT family N-acetyltransferase [Enterococcus alcedinis]MBP2101405.1 GNAT superfamily N-acetyltransferase [Enterococcus alcedinis]GGI65202.1 acetyltransferase [Enterococcus alcedinis]